MLLLPRLAAALLLLAPAALAQQTVADAQAEALRRYPDLGLSGSPLNQRYVEAVTTARKERPQLFSDPRWPLLLAEEVAGSSAPGGATADDLLAALDANDVPRIIKAAATFAHPSTVLRARITEAGERLGRAGTALVAAQRTRRELEPELVRLRRNATMADRVNPLIPTDKSGKERAAQMRRKADEMAARADDAITRAQEEGDLAVAELRKTLAEIQLAEATAERRRAEEAAQAAEKTAAMRENMERTAAQEQYLSIIGEPDGLPPFAAAKVTPSYEETLDFVNSRLQLQGWKLRFGARSQKFLLVHPGGAWFLELAHLSPGVKSVGDRPEAFAQLQVGRSDVTIRGLDGTGAPVDNVRTLSIPCADAIDAEKVAKALRHLILMAGGREDLF